MKKKSKTITLNLSELLENIGCLVGILLAASIILSFFCMLATRYNETTCDTKAYYLPATYILCSLQEKR